MCRPFSFDKDAIIQLFVSAHTQNLHWTIAPADKLAPNDGSPKQTYNQIKYPHVMR